MIIIANTNRSQVRSERTDAELYHPCSLLAPDCYRCPGMKTSISSAMMNHSLSFQSRAQPICRPRSNEMSSQYISTNWDTRAHSHTHASWRRRVSHTAGIVMQMAPLQQSPAEDSHGGRRFNHPVDAWTHNCIRPVFEKKEVCFMMRRQVNRKI